MSQFDNKSQNLNELSAAIFSDCLANSKEIFELIDSVFPVDSCQHYEVLPLALVGKDLSLGILDPNNEESLKFVNSIANVYKYNLQLRLIDRQTLEIILASYNKSSQQSQRQNKDLDRKQTVIDATVIDQEFRPHAADSTANYNQKRRLADSAPTIISVPDEDPSPKPPKASVLDDLPPDMDFLRDIDLSPQPTKKPRPAAEDSVTLYEIPPEFQSQSASKNLDDKPTIITENPAELLSQISHQEPASQNYVVDSPLRAVQKQEPEAEFLAALLPQLSWQKLLEQAFQHHSETIQLTRYENRGSIVAKKQEDPQSLVDNVPLPIFCSLIDEIKRMARLPLDLSNHPKKVVLERFYQQERILLRLEFAIQEAQEVVIVQIIRGESLGIYEQKQMNKACEQALYLAKQLEKTLRRIQACFDSAEFTNIKEIQTVQSRINHQLRLLDK